ncbi:RecQ family ATP-dependent DNA helicase [Sulfobacillus thermosulfidooxidans]|uniref:RecQ family ATP-dependent DNA helicase n=1 Tax=Sulfobacillus thermosulfidooxidans TaxID=28034 RepID=UPI0006B50D6A|nr:RecQ family ATP-dependent DNA helicase [Sulfobacillus thermosulfidooxidans]
MDTIGISESLHRKIEWTLHNVFHLPDFRPLQREIISHVFLNISQLAILPTGAGKSLCYQLPSVLLPAPTVVISPLLSLMREQTQRLNELGIRAAHWSHWEHLGEGTEDVLTAWARGRLRVIFLAPERLRHPDLLRQIDRLPCSLLVVDEAHSISEWGHDFRPDYRRIKQFHRLLGQPPILALTATATPQVEDDILRQLGLSPEKCLVTRQSMDRANIFLAVEKVASSKEQHHAVLDAIQQESGAVIVYTTTRKQAEYWGRWIHQAIHEPTGIYHAGLTQKERMAVHDAFSTGHLRIVAATTAFGMGIDRSDVRGVLNIGMPESLDAYTQEWGRAGRDGQRAWARLIVTPQDMTQRRRMLERERPREQTVQQIMKIVDRWPLHRGVWWDLNSAGTMTLDEGSLDFEAMAEVIVTALEEMDVVEVLAKKAHQMFVRVKKPVESWMTQALNDRLQRLYAHRTTQYEQMKAYIDTARCRREAIYQYFGQSLSTPSHTPQLCCDRCAQSSFSGPQPALINTESDRKVWEKLRAWRQQQALDEKVAAYLIFSDRVLHELCERQPKTWEELRQCPGIGPVKLARYGQALIALFRQASEDKPIKTSDRVRVKSAKEQAWNLFAEGLPVPEVAERVNRRPSTVIGYLEEWIIQDESRAWSWYGESLVHPEVQQQVEDCLTHDPNQTLKSLFIALQGKYSYDQLRIARALVKKSRRAPDMRC